MTFFNQSTPRRPHKIIIDSDAVSSTSPVVRQRMDRIAENYQRLDLMLTEIEAKIQNDERLSAIDETIVEVELNINGKKKKWRPRQKKSANPKKPR